MYYYCGGSRYDCIATSSLQSIQDKYSSQMHVLLNIGSGAEPATSHRFWLADAPGAPCASPLEAQLTLKLAQHPSSPKMSQSGPARPFRRVKQMGVSRRLFCRRPTTTASGFHAADLAGVSHPRGRSPMH